MAVKIWVDESLEIELKRIQVNLKRKIGNGIDFSRPQASRIAAAILKNRKNVEIKKGKKRNTIIANF